MRVASHVHVQVMLRGAVPQNEGEWQYLMLLIVDLVVEVRFRIELDLFHAINSGKSLRALDHEAVVSLLLVLTLLELSELVFIKGLLLFVHFENTRV